MDYVALAVQLGVQNGFIAGKEYRARCPLHQDTNPSFSLNIQTGMYNCFAGCGGGEFVRLVELVLDCSPQEAHDWIKANGRGTSVEQLGKQLAEALGQTPIGATNYLSPLYWKEVYELTTNQIMPMWFLQRGFTWHTVNFWGLHYDNIGDAIIIPVYWDDELVGTITRNTNSHLPKYQNSPNLPKSKILFGEISETKDEIIIVEGVLDALWLWQLGYNVVSILGSHLSGEQVDILKGYRFGEIVLALDNDEAGQAGTDEAIGKLTYAGWLLPQITIINFPGVDKESPAYRKDPQDCSMEEFAQLYANRRDVIYGL